MQNLKHVEKQRVLVVVEFNTGESLFGFFHAGHLERVSDVLNDGRMFMPFEELDGECLIHAKTSITRVYEICNVTRHFQHPDPYVVLDVSRGDSWETVQSAHRRQMALCQPARHARRNPSEAALELLDRIARRLDEVLEQIRLSHFSNAA